MNGTTRRDVLRTGLIATGAALTWTAPVHAQARMPGLPFAPVLEQPASVRVFLNGGTVVPLQKFEQAWTGGACRVGLDRAADGMKVSLAAPGVAALRVHLRWAVATPVAGVRVLGDAWERSYGDLGWGEVVPEKPLPWYFLTHANGRTHGYGVQVGAGSFAFWQFDEDGISLWLDVRNGGRGVLLGERVLAMATIVSREGAAGETPMAAAAALCRLMAPKPRASIGPIYGSNDWYYAYGGNTPAGVLRDADLMAELAPATGPRPFVVADGGWEDRARFPDMQGLAAGIKAKGVRPGIWVRPTLPVGKVNPGLLLADARFASARDAAENPSFDPTIPEALELSLEKAREPRRWGYELMKYDFLTYDLFGQWGFEMGASPARGGWSFHDRSKTSAEIVRAYYAALCEAGGDSVMIGCNAFGHLGAGIFDAQRTGDDVSGRVWDRTRKMGVNTLAFRLPQHGTFFALDADCVPFTEKIPWALTKQWLDVVASSGTVLMVSPEPGQIGAEQKVAIRAGFAGLVADVAAAAPVDGLESHTPEAWVRGGRRVSYRWLESVGADPFSPA